LFERGHVFSDSFSSSLSSLLDEVQVATRREWRNVLQERKWREVGWWSRLVT